MLKAFGCRYDLNAKKKKIDIIYVLTSDTKKI